MFCQMYKFGVKEVFLSPEALEKVIVFRNNAPYLSFYNMPEFLGIKILNFSMKKLKDLNLN